MKLIFESGEALSPDDTADALELIARLLRDDFTSGDAHGAGWWSVEGMGDSSLRDDEEPDPPDPDPERYPDA